MEYKDYYKSLGVDKKASQEEIKKKYKKLAREYHPDVNPGNAQAEAKFKEISEAYEVLSDPESRKKYDQLGADWKRYEQAGTGGFNQWAHANQGSGQWYTNFGGDPGGADFSDFFSSFFGGGNSQAHSRRQKGHDLRANMQISLQDAYEGGPMQFSVNGQNLRINLKPGVQDGQVIRLKGKGEPVRPGGEPGDLLLTFEIKPDKQFIRKGDDLYLDLEVPLYAMVLGTELQVPTMGAPVKITLKPETKNGETLRLKGKGMPAYGKHHYGDLYVKLLALLPTHLSAEEKELFQKLEKLRK